MKRNIKRPLRFTPYYKQVIWGGSRIEDYKQQEIPLSKVGESWEISAVPGHESVVTDDSELSGATIAELVDSFGDALLGTDVAARYGLHFPLLVKLIDASSNLSVQVHPDDEMAARLHNAPGKDEIWYVLGASSESRIFCGLSAPLDPEKFDECVKSETIMDVISTYHSAPRQFYFVPAGTPHAIGAGNLVAEVQRASDITYRIYDYGRKDSDGKLRPLHIAEARQAINYNYPTVAMPSSCIFDTTRFDAVKSEHFKLDYLVIRNDNDAVTVDTRRRTFAILMVTEGALDIIYDDNIATCRAGVTVLLPADIGEVEFRGCATALFIHC